MTLQIDIINQSTAMSDYNLESLLPVLMTQINRDFRPFWQTDEVSLSLVSNPTSGRPRILILDNSDQAGDLGYHLDDEGTPEAKVFAAEDAKYGVLFSVTLSHELLEMMADPFAFRIIPQPDGSVWIVEVCDPVESDSDGYDIDGTRVSNFVTPRYFGLTSSDARFDFRGLLGSGMPSVRPGGYLMWYADGIWQSKYGRLETGAASYRARRELGRSRFRASQIRD